jgi:hypothetical protein
MEMQLIHLVWVSCKWAAQDLTTLAQEHIEAAIVASSIQDYRASHMPGPFIATNTRQTPKIIAMLTIYLDAHGEILQCLDWVSSL